MKPQSMESILKGRHSQPHQLIEVMQDVQENYGYIPEDAMKEISATLGVPLIEVYRVAAFYKAFKLKPSGKYAITICNGTACHVRGAGLLLDQAISQLGIQPGEVTEDGLFSIECVNCLGACALGPVASENGNLGHHMTPAKFRKFIASIREKEKEEAGDVAVRH
jgi:NADH:ubiquinone oxidoreductase subunit E